MAIINFKYPEKFNEVLEQLENPDIWYFSIHGGRDSGKSHGVAQGLIELALTEKCRILCAREIQNSIGDSSKKLLEDKINEFNLHSFFTIKDKSIECINGSEFLFKGLYRNTQSIKSLEKIKYCWVEEAQSLSLDSLRTLIPTVRQPGKKFFFTYNPLEDPDPIVEYLSKKDKERIFDFEMNYYHNPFMSPETREEADYLKTIDIDEWSFIYDGKPNAKNPNAVLTHKEVMQAVHRQLEPIGAIEVGADIARFGDDTIQFYKRKGHKIIEERTYKKIPLTETARHLADFIQYNPDVPIKVDDSGLGGGVTDMLRDWNLNAVPVNNGATAQEPDRYPNAISEMWFHVKSIINQISIPNDKKLIQQLTRRRFKYDSKGRRCIESKDEYKKRYGNSPDKADAFLLSFYEVYNNVLSVVSLGNIF